MRVVGRVEQLWIYPVRSLAGRAVPAVGIGATGLAGDRAWTPVGGDGAVLRAKQHPAVRDVVATGDPDADAAALTGALGRAVRLSVTEAAPGEVAPVHLVSRRAIDRAAAGDVPEGCSPDDPRANVVLALDEEDERAWVGEVVRIGDAVLRITRTPKHCLGVYADVRTPGEVRVGDPVLL
ncbi:MOSC N-terminal beta barrel domain-containing protein [Blastococcus sp. PRF04-17]|uniref:MOSC N-terminal beta barrel domain-containing protein n=1 Tax=Blastococcus sp. PRF04-17 TaxID=2933797 RepID=UPI001FF3A75A|nr:MOSC domain-containing protein [Blastococcus sp. PRF04-17]UOY02813.1 MOSC N-terminal beta barrel domain-containing protein [Blastococcus sp. PRF04-17]